MQISWQIEGQKQLSRNLRLSGKRIRDWTPAFKRIAKEIKETFEGDVFSTEGKSIGEKWPKLSPRYLAQKRKAGYSSKPLVRTGDMQKSFKSLYKSDMAAVWNTAIYFKYHQSIKPRRKIPRRAMMKIYHEQREVIQKIFHTQLIKKFK